MIDKLLKDVEKLAAEEMNKANLVHPHFHSRHEGIAVIEEEVEECEDEMDMMKFTFGLLKPCVFRDEITDADLEIKVLEVRANRLAAEAIQVAAMCRKWRKSFE